MKPLATIVLTVIGCNLFLIYMIGYILMRPRRKRDKDGKIIWGSERDQ